MNPIELSLTLDEINQVLEALGRRPYARVHQLIGKIHRQAAPQLPLADAAPDPHAPAPLHERASS